MATITHNVFTEGLSGRLGNALVFRTMRGKTFVTTPARKPARRRESVAQRGTRVTFREASQWAQHILQDDQQKAYYQQRAKKLKLPNAYTAALTDYLRKPQLTTFTNKDQSVSCRVKKKDFTLKKVEVIITKADGEEVRSIKPGDGHWSFLLKKEELSTARIRVLDAADRETIILMDYKAVLQTH